MKQEWHTYTAQSLLVAVNTGTNLPCGNVTGSQSHFVKFCRHPTPQRCGSVHLTVVVMNEAVNKGNEEEGPIIDSKIVLLHRPTLGRRVALEYSQVSVDGH